MRMAGDAADLLLGNRPGLLLIGPERQTRAVVRLVLDRLSAWPIIPILFAAPGASRVALRDAVGQAHATRSDPKASLLLVIEEADLLSPALLSELEQAAGAAAEYGGLQFLLAGQQDLAPTLQRDGRAALSKCLRTRLSVRAPVLPVDPRGAAASVIGPPRRDPVAATRPRPERRIMRAGAVLTGCVVIAGLVAAAYLHERPVRLTPPALVAQRVDPPLPPPDSPASSPQVSRTIPVAPQPISPQPAMPVPAPPDTALAQTNTPPSPPQPDAGAQPVSPEVPMPEQPDAAPALTVAAAAPPSAPITQPDRPTQDREAAMPASPVVTPEQPDQPAGASSAHPPAVSPLAAIATVVPPAASPSQAVTVPNPAVQPADRQQQDAPSASTSPAAPASQSPDAIVIENLPPRQPLPPGPPALSPAASDRPQQAQAMQPSQPVAVRMTPPGDTPRDLPLQPVPPAAASIQIQQLPPLRQAGSVDGPPPLTGSSTSQPQGLPAPQRQALLLLPMPVLPSPPPPLPRVPQFVPQTPAGASLLLLAGPNDTLRSLYREVYRGVRPPRFETVAALNPAVTRPGTRLIFPAPPDGWPAQRRSRR